MRDTREIQTEPVRGGKKTESEAGVELRRNQFQPVAVAELAGVVGGRRWYGFSSTPTLQGDVDGTANDDDGDGEDEVVTRSFA